ncbi:hypothetical protein PS467_00275 [Streptomyces luomodiensis]|uniref:Uncharacterized protein n=1 Tax=Streptomyces luomodiensis TaxID=3026192 RepID=A0ABY9UPM4_9ACTN|nr:hypothetical protein [Streptomyces sp. SCA4-21]WNE93885.1 hypothetical protein PS467_00275 [Streptomyces sp. SCA4-21]
MRAPQQLASFTPRPPGPGDAVPGDAVPGPPAGTVLAAVAVTDT